MAVPLPTLGSIANIEALTALDLLELMDLVYIKPDTLTARAAVDSDLTVGNFFHAMMALWTLNAVLT
jgi:hypothetical protein